MGVMRYELICRLLAEDMDEVKLQIYPMNNTSVSLVTLHLRFNLVTLVNASGFITIQTIFT